MAGHVLIDSYLAELRPHVPSSAWDELADGLLETYEHNLAAGLEQDAAATGALHDFGTIEQISHAFVANAPGHRAARVLLFTGPLVGLSWAATFLTATVWTWHLPVGAAIAFGLGLFAAVVVLAVALRATRCARTRLTAIGGAGALLLDAGLIAATVALAPSPVWPMAVAIPASLARAAYVVRMLPRIARRSPLG
ncbi:hypothetical protein [Kribbella sp. NPDC050470]|uniref:hypothetical protein n=1 Tax=unclassified Kribbella TaxID=2644121 RepID=UPI00378FD735